MFQFLFNYPSSVFAKGEFVLLGGWPRWLLAFLILATAAGLALFTRSRLSQALPRLRTWRSGVIWLLQFSLITLLIIMLWDPAMVVAELKPQQNIIAVLVDDSRSMSIVEGGTTRQAQAVDTLRRGMLAALEKDFQTRLYRLDSHPIRIAGLAELKPEAAVTHIGESLKQLVNETADLPIGAIVLLSDGADNSGGVDRETISALRDRHMPVHTIGFGREQASRDIEITEAEVAPRALANSRLSTIVRLRQRGYAGRKAMLKVRDGETIIAGREITLGPDGNVQTETLMLNAGAPGAKSVQFSIDVLPGEENAVNNTLVRLLNVESDQRRVLYFEGEPRWEYKFIRRAQEGDPILRLASILRTTENKFYRQGIDDPSELAGGFPTHPEDLCKYHGLIIGSVEASYFSPAQQDSIRQFVDRRGGGLLLLGGRWALSEGGWSSSSLADLLPAVLPNKAGTFHRDPVVAELTSAGAESTICRLADEPDRNLERWKKLPYLMNYQEPGAPKPGATVLAESRKGGRKVPLLITENYGRGRTAILATEGTWRWRMLLPLGNRSHELFWQQLLRWLVSDTPGQVVASIPNETLFDDGHVQLRADIRGKDYTPLPEANVQARISGPDGTTAVLDLSPDASTGGVFQGEWTVDKPGLYHAEITARRGEEDVGRDSLIFQRLDGMAENFRTEQNRELLEKLSAQTGGRYWRPQDVSKLAREIPYSEAGITIRETKELWNMPIVFLLILGLRSSEWLLRRKWGVV